MTKISFIALLLQCIRSILNMYSLHQYILM